MQHPELEIPPLLVVPFAALLLSIAILPLAAPHFWDENKNKGLVAAGLSVPVFGWLALHSPSALGHAGIEYASFIVLLGALYIIAGGVHLDGDLLATPGHNTALLAVGGVLANLMGTTGASMLLIHLVLRTNRQRVFTSHLPLFFILVVSNCGGLLTPLGDPPLFLGYLRGVPFTWTFRLLPIWLVAMGYLLTLFYVLDRRAYAKESPEARARDERELEPLRIRGAANFVLLLLVVGCVFLPTPYRELLMGALTLASLFVTNQTPRKQNDFHFHAINEVAILFAGIFVTMVPALKLLEQHGQSLGLAAPWQFFVTTGFLSSVLDNAPTYLTFLATAQGLGLPNEVVETTHVHLLAISAGAVLMGANTYIGNGPNFMVKAIADRAGYKTASFFGHAGKAIVYLSPIYVFTIAYLALAG